MRRQRVRLAVPALLAFGAFAAACSGGGDGKDDACSPDVVHYEGYATDETCLVMLEAEAAGAVQIGGPNAAVLVSPTDGGAVASTATSLTISWDTPLDLDTSFARRTGVRRTPAGAAPASWRETAAGLARDLASGLLPVATAWAHEPPVTGAIHQVRLKGIAGHEGVATYYTSLQFLVLTGHGLEHVTTAPDGQVAIEITSVYLEDNRIVTPSTDGPFRAASDSVVNVQ